MGYVCKFMFNFVADTEAAVERNFRTRILACAGNKPSTGRTGNIVERNDARCGFGLAIDGQSRCILYSKKRNTAVERERERERMEKGIRKKKEQIRKESERERQRETINTIEIEYRKALGEKEKERERNFRGTKGSVRCGRI